ncbi:OsmC family protein [Propionivibrio soli]|uniref:OsmC family protein n=1 Tax=Propionivibrio soli TaxID=2976531 RepID=UPI0021E6E502|nr:OsmC family protein [Propionivibrio soli]
MHSEEKSPPVVVAENGRGRYQQSIAVGMHMLIADEPAAKGGEAVGPAPYDYLLAALGSCTSMTLRMYAERKALPLHRVSVELTHEKVEVDGAKVDRIERTITLEGDLTAEQRARMLEIANKCPVYRTLCSDIDIRSRVTE